MGLGLLFAGISGAGKGLAESAEQAQKVMDEKALMEERARLEEEKILRIEQVRADRAREAGVKQGQDIEAGVRSIQDERIASKIYADEGPNLTAEDVRAKRDAKGGSAIEGLLNSSRQSILEDRADVSSKLGYADAAKQYRGEASDEARDARENKRLDAQEKNAKFEQQYRMRREARIDKLAKSDLDYRKSRAEKEDARADGIEAKEQRAATSAALQGVNDNIKSLERALSASANPEQIALIEGQIQEARLEAAGYRKALASVGISGPTPQKDAPTKAPPDGTRLRKGGNTYVVRNGIPVLEGK